MMLWPLYIIVVVLVPALLDPPGGSLSLTHVAVLHLLLVDFLDPRGGSLSLTHVVVLHLLLVDFFVSQPTVFIETWRIYVKIPCTDSNHLRF